MSESSATETGGAERRLCVGWVSFLLAASAGAAILVGIALAVDRADTEPLESPLLLSVARQLIQSPAELYGPFGGQNLWVLIHAPLYYRASAGLAWLFVRGGGEPVTAALAAGRAISALGLAATLAAVFALARRDGSPARAGWWAVFLVLIAPVVGTQPYSVRPDMLGVALQSIGILLVVRELDRGSRRGPMVIVAYIAFALAACVKQHFVAAPAISTALLFLAWRRREGGTSYLAAGPLAALAVVAAVFGTEELVSAGGMSRAIFVAASHVRDVHPANWARVFIVFLTILGKSAGMVALFTAVTLCRIAARPAQPWRSLVLVVGACGIGIIIAYNLQALIESSQEEITKRAAIVCAMMAVMLPLSAIAEWRSSTASRLDRILWIFLAGELAVVTLLSRQSTGAWINYAIQAIALAAILTARALARALDSAATARALAFPALAVIAIPATLAHSVYPDLELRRLDRDTRKMIFDHFQRPPHEYFFVDRPGDNRLGGRIDLVYDDWLYPVFESMGLAENRSNWLRQRLTDGRIRFVVGTSASPRVPGVNATLPSLGFVARIEVGPYFVWERVRGITPPSR